MKQGSFFERFYTAGDWLFKLIALQLIFLLSVVITLGVFGLFPGLAAGFATVRQWLMGKNSPMVKTYVRYFKDYFGQANLLGYMLLLCSISVGLYIYWFQQLNGTASNIVLFIAFFLAIFLAILWIFLFPVLVHFDIKTLTVLKFALIIGISRPLHTIGIIVLFIAMYFWIRLIPLFLILFDISLLLLIWMAIAHNGFKKYS